MAEITAGMVKELRELTGLGMMECKKALEEAHGDMKKAEELRAAGQTGPSAQLLAINRTQRGLVLHTLGTLVFIVILVDMIWKPGA